MRLLNTLGKFFGSGGIADFWKPGPPGVLWNGAWTNVGTYTYEAKLGGSPLVPPVFVSASNEQPGGECHLVFQTSNWYSWKTEPYWFEVDLGQNYDIKQYKIGVDHVVEASGPSSWALKGWVDGDRGGASTTLDSQAGYDGAQWHLAGHLLTLTPATPGVFRYLRLELVSAADTWMYVNKVDFLVNSPP